LNYWFPPAEGFDVCPQWTIPNTRRSTDFSITYVVEFRRCPLLLLEIKPPADFFVDSGREAAIIQVIQRFDEVGPTNHYLERLYGISAIGKRWRAAYVSKGSSSKNGQPVGDLAEVSSLRSAEEGCWNPDVTSDTSYKVFEDMVKTIKGPLTNLVSRYLFLPIVSIDIISLYRNSEFYGLYCCSL